MEQFNVFRFFLPFLGFASSMNLFQKLSLWIPCQSCPRAYLGYPFEYIDSPSTIDCKVLAHLPPLSGSVANIVSQLRTHSHDLNDALREVTEFTSSFRTPHNKFSEESLNMSRRSLLIGLKCNRLNVEVPNILATRWTKYARNDRPEYAPIFSAINPPLEFGQETISDDHGLIHVAEAHRKYVEAKAIMDIGAWIGDSTLILSRYGRVVYSFEFSPALFRMMVRVLNQTYPYSQNVHPINAGISDKVGWITLNDQSNGYVTVDSQQPQGVHVPLMTIDSFVEKYRETIGFFKVDIEGHGLDVIRGAMRTLKSQRPIFGLVCYHEWEEMFEVPRLIKRKFPEYDFEWHMHGPTNRQMYLNELTFYAFPRNLSSRALIMQHEYLYNDLI